MQEFYVKVFSKLHTMLKLSYCSELQNKVRQKCVAGSFCLLFFVSVSGALAQENLRGEDSHLPLRPGKAGYWENVINVIEDPHVQTTGKWGDYLYRQSFPTRRHLVTTDDGASLKRTFDSSGLVLVLETHFPYVFRYSLNNGILEVVIDGEITQVINLLTEANEIVLYRDRETKPREVKLRHRHAPGGGRGVRIIGFRELHEPSADLALATPPSSGPVIKWK